MPFVRLVCRVDASCLTVYLSLCLCPCLSLAFYENCRLPGLPEVLVCWSVTTRGFNTTPCLSARSVCTYDTAYVVVAPGARSLHSVLYIVHIIRTPSLFNYLVPGTWYVVPEERRAYTLGLARNIQSHVHTTGTEVHTAVVLVLVVAQLCFLGMLCSSLVSCSSLSYI